MNGNMPTTSLRASKIKTVLRGRRNTWGTKSTVFDVCRQETRTEKRKPSKKTMALAHEHILSCAVCRRPLLLKGLHPSYNTEEAQAVITYQLSVAEILAQTPKSQSNVLSYLQPVAEKDSAATPAKEAATIQHVLHMEGFDNPSKRRAFAKHCGLDPMVFEGHFEDMSRMVGAGVGKCWCECHLQDGLKLLSDEDDDEDDDGFRPSILVPLVKMPQDGEDQNTLSDGGKTMLEKKRKRWSATEAKKWPELKRAHRGTGSQWTL